MERALISLGAKELAGLIEEDQGAELVCHFCRARYQFSTAELRDMLARATRGKPGKGQQRDEDADPQL